MTDDRRYCPVLRWRQAERDALRDLGEDIRAHVTPLIELLPSKVPLFDDAPRRDYIDKMLADLSRVWSERTFIDTHWLRPHFLIGGKSPLNGPLFEARKAGLKAVPVLPLPRRNDDPHLNVFCSREDRLAGACIRVKPLDLDLGLPAAKRKSYFEAFLRHLKLEPGQIDLIVDEEFTCDLAPSYEQICDRIPYIRDWRSFAVISGDFPADLQEFERGLIHSRRRNDWERWRRSVSTGTLLRRPAYGDYTVQYATYRTFPPGQIPNPSVSVRYTADDKWLILRGEAHRENGPGTEQWIGWAQLLTTKSEFKGSDFSAGDRYIHERAGGAVSHGNFTTWISSGINHHITLATKQVSSLRAA